MFETSGMSSPHTQTASGDVGGAAEQAVVTEGDSAV